MDDLRLFDDSERNDVDQAIVVEAFVEIDVARDIRNADRVAVRADAVDHALRDVALVRSRIDRAEAQRIGDGDHFGAHAQHVAHDAADPGRGAFERHDLRRMIVRFVRDDDAVALAAMLAQMQDAGIFGGAEHDRRAGRRKILQVMAARFIAAMLAPLRIERVEFDHRRIALRRLGDATKFVGPQRHAGFRRSVAQRLVVAAFDGEANQGRLPVPAAPPAAASSRRHAK